MLCQGEQGNSREWFIDSGGSQHMTRHAERLKNLRATDSKDIMCANKERMQVKAMGDSTLSLDADVTLNNVLLIPNLGVNLLSVSKIVEKGNTVFFDSTGCTIKNTGGQIVAHVQAENGVYKLREKSESCMVAYDSYTWHRRLGHMNFNSLTRMRDGQLLAYISRTTARKSRTAKYAAKEKCAGIFFRQVKLKRKPFLR